MFQTFVHLGKKIYESNAIPNFWLVACISILLDVPTNIFSAQQRRSTFFSRVHSSFFKQVCDNDSTFDTHLSDFNTRYYSNYPARRNDRLFCNKIANPKSQPWVTRGRVYTFSLTVVICDTFGWRSIDAKSASRRLCALPPRYSFANTRSPPWLGRQCVLISRGYTRASSLFSCNMCA